MKAKRADQTLQAAAACHQEGRLAEAEKLYRSVLALKPRTHLALHNLGVIALGKGETDDAIRLIGLSIKARPDYAAGHANLALAYEQAGRIEEAVASLERAIRLAPGNGGNHFNLANLLRKSGRIEAAEASYRQALSANPHDAEALAGLGAVLIEQGRTEEGIAAYRRATDSHPRSADAWNALATALRGIDAVEEAEDSYRQAIAADPRNVVAPVNLARLLIDQGRADDAIAVSEALLKIVPGLAQAHETMGSALLAEGKNDEALACFDEALTLDPANPLAHVGRGTALRAQGEVEAALEALRAALALNPSLHEVWRTVGEILEPLGRSGEAILAYSKAIRAKPGDADAVFCLARTFLNLNRGQEALTCYRRALALDDSNAEGQCGYGHVLGLTGDLDGAIAAFEKAESLKPGAFVGILLHYRQKICRWDGIADLTARALDSARTGIGDVSPFATLSLPSTPADQKMVGERASARMEREARPALPPCPPESARDRLRIGYLSGDLHAHPVTLLIAEMLELHDRERFEIAAYSYGPPRNDGVRERVKAATEHFIDVRDLPFAGAAQRIRDDGVDILVDLTGHTLFSRSVITAFRPAPVQVSYLGFPGTMGAGFIDYIIADPYLAPMDQQPFFTENIVHLPDGYQPGDRKRRARPVRRADQGLPENALVFAAFNNPNKITPAIFDIWMRLLREAPGSVLWLLSDAPVTENNLRHEAALRGVAGERLIFANRVDIPDYLGRLALADLFLDCHPYNAGATANDALWMGLPVLTCSGDTYVSRMAGSLLTTIGLPELITHSLSDYEARAVELIRDPARLEAIRARLTERRETSPLFDTARYTRNLEAAYTRMWEIHTAGEAPRPFAVRPASNRQILPLS